MDRWYRECDRPSRPDTWRARIVGAPKLGWPKGKNGLAEAVAAREVEAVITRAAVAERKRLCLCMTIPHLLLIGRANDRNGSLAKTIIAMFINWRARLAELRGPRRCQGGRLSESRCYPLSPLSPVFQP